MNNQCNSFHTFTACWHFQLLQSSSR